VPDVDQFFREVICRLEFDVSEVEIESVSAELLVEEEERIVDVPRWELVSASELEIVAETTLPLPRAPRAPQPVPAATLLPTPLPTPIVITQAPPPPRSDWTRRLTATLVFFAIVVNAATIAMYLRPEEARELLATASWDRRAPAAHAPGPTSAPQAAPQVKARPKAGR
jgi:hypothetical protein